MSDHARETVELPDRVTVLTCIGCGAMGRQEACEHGCSEHKLVLVPAVDHEALLVDAQHARERAARLAPVVRALAEGEREPSDPRAALIAIRERARQALREDRRPPDRTDPEAPGTVTGWWCAQCGNVDLPQPCIGVCVWRPADWVNVAVHERQAELAAPVLAAERALSRLLTRVATVTPREDRWQANWEALRLQARTALER